MYHSKSGCRWMSDLFVCAMHCRCCQARGRDDFLCGPYSSIIPSTRIPPLINPRLSWSFQCTGSTGKPFMGSCEIICLLFFLWPEGYSFCFAHRALRLCARLKLVLQHPVCRFCFSFTRYALRQYLCSWLETHVTGLQDSRKSFVFYNVRIINLNNV